MPPRQKNSQPSPLLPDGTLRIDHGLTEYEEMVPAWRMKRGLTPPRPAPFDVEAALAWAEEHTYASWDPGAEQFDMPVRMTREQAWFWLLFASHRTDAYDPGRPPRSRKTLLQFIRDKLVDDEWFHWTLDHVAAVLTFLSPAEVVEMIRRGPQIGRSVRHLHECTTFLLGCSMFMTPFLSADECQSLSETSLDDLKADPAANTAPGAAALAVLAVLGNMDDVTASLSRRRTRSAITTLWMASRTRSAECFTTLVDRLAIRGWGMNTAKIILAATGTTRLDLLQMASWAHGKPERASVLRVLARVIDPGISPLMLELRPHCPEALKWLQRHPLHAAVGLSGLATPAAKMYWRDLWRTAPDSAARAVELSPEEHRAALLRLAPGDRSSRSEAQERTPAALQRIFNRAPSGKLPAWLAVSTLPAPFVEGLPLTSSSTTKLLLILKHLSGGSPKELLKPLKKLADADSLDLLAEALFEKWYLARQPPADMWVMTAATALSPDHFPQRLARFMAFGGRWFWPPQRACAAVRALATVGSAAAVSQLYHLAHDTGESQQKKEALSLLSEAAESVGLSLEAFADGYVPSAGFDVHGRRSFRAGDLSFEARLDPHRAVVFLRPDGTTTPRLPHRAKDLPPDEYRRLCRQVRHARRLVRDTMIIQTGRLRRNAAHDFRRTVAAFNGCVLQHPVLSRVASELVWEATPRRGGAFRFRPTDDGSLVAADGLPVALPQGGSVRVAHGAEMPPQEVAAWLQHIEDHGIVQPFQQFTSVAFRPMATEAEGTAITRFQGEVVISRQLKEAFAASQWSHDKPQENGGFTRHFKAYPTANLFACVRHSYVTAGRCELDSDPISLHTAWFVRADLPKKDWRNSKNHIPLRQVPPAIFDDVCALLHRLTGLPAPSA